MQAVILAGGMGTRLKPLTDKIPKVMVLVNGKPFLWHLLKLLESQGVNDIILCIGYLGKQVKDFFGNGGSLGMRIRYSEETDRLLGTGGALRQSKDLLDSHFFVINGDTYLPIEYNKLDGAFLKSRKNALMVVYESNDDTGIRNNVELDNESIIIKYDKENPDSKMKHVDAGVLIISQKVLDTLEKGCPVSMEKEVYPVLAQRRELAAYVTKQRFYDIGIPGQLQVLEDLLKQALK